MKLISNNPIEITHAKEITKTFMSFCSFISIINNKKMNLPNVFIILLKEPKLRNIFKELLDIETDFELVQLFLFYEPSLYKSKYIMKYLNNKRKKIIH